MRFKIDENLPPDLVELLGSHGHDAATIYDQGMSGHDDDKILHVCQQEVRVLVTLDLDFADLRTYPPENYPGLMVLRLSRQSKRHVLNTFRRVVPLLDQEPLTGRLWIIDELELRIRGGDET